MFFSARKSESTNVATVVGTSRSVGMKSLVLLSALLFGGAQAAYAVPAQTAFVVTNAGDTTTGIASDCQTATMTATSCSFRDALIAVSGASPLSTTITFSPTVFTTATTITTAHGAYTVVANANLTITGATTGTGGTLTNLITLSGGSVNQVFTVPSGATATLANLTITNGTTAGNGGCISNAGVLTITQSTVTGCTSSGNGGSVYNNGTLTVTGSTIYGNTGGTYGGGIFSDNLAIALTVSNSTFTGNTAVVGGGIATFAGALSLTHVTLTGNRGSGGGLGAYSSVAPTFVGNLIAGNSSPNGSSADYYSGQGFYTFPPGNDINSSNATTTPTAYQPNLAPLGTYGGPTLTMPALPGPVTGDTIAFCYAQIASSPDQRGFSGTTYNGVVCNDAGATQSTYTVAYSTQPAASYNQSTVMGATAPVVKFYDHGFSIPAAVGSVVFTDLDSVIAGTTTVALSAGSASPTAASFTTPETGDTLTGKYTLTLPTSATAVLSTPASNTFNVISATPTQVVLSAITSPITAGSSIGSFTASLETAGGAVTTSTASVSYVLTSPTSITIASGSANAVAGVASFNIPLPLTATGTYTLTVSSGTLTNGVKSIVVNAGVATKLVYTSNAPSGTANVAAYTIGPIGVTVEDAYGNTVTTPATTITYTLTGTTGFTTLTGTVTSANGIGTVFPAGQGLSVPTSYTLTCSSGTLTSAVATFTVVQLTPVVTLTIPSPISYGTTLAGLTPSATYNGSAVAGSFTYTATLSGGSPVTVTTTSVLTPGTYVIKATFLPSNATTYASGQTGSAALVVNKATPTVLLSASSSTIFVNNPITLTASVPAVGAGVFPTLTVTFKNGTTAVGSANLTPVGSTSNTAVFVYKPTTSGAETLTAVYGGDSNYTTATSAPLTEGVVDFTITASPQIIQTTRGATATTVITLTPVGGTTFPGALTLTLNSTNLSITSVSLSPTTIASGATTGSSTLSIVIPATFAKMEMQHGIDPRVNGYAPVAFALLLLPFANRMRKASKRLKTMMLALVLGVCAMGTLSGCSGKYHGNHVSEDIAPVVVTATNGTATHSITVTAVVAE